MSEQNPNPTPAPAAPAAPAPAAPAPAASDPAAIAQAVLQAIEARNQRTERSIVKSMADQHGLTEEELNGILERAKADKAKQLPPEVQRQLDEANRRAEGILLSAEVRTLGAAMGLHDPEVALSLLDRSKIKIEGDAVTGVQEALDALKASKGYLFADAQPAPQQQPRAWGQQHGSGAGDDPEAAFRRVLGLKNK